MTSDFIRLKRILFWKVTIYLKEIIRKWRLIYLFMLCITYLSIFYNYYLDLIRIKNVALKYLIYVNLKILTNLKISDLFILYFYSSKTVWFIIAYLAQWFSFWNNLRAGNNFIRSFVCMYMAETTRHIKVAVNFMLLWKPNKKEYFEQKTNKIKNVNKLCHIYNRK